MNKYIQELRPAKAVWLPYGYQFGVPGEDFTHYMIVGEPE